MLCRSASLGGRIASKALTGDVSVRGFAHVAKQVSISVADRDSHDP